MRKLIVVILVLAGLWAGYWMFGAKTTEKAFGQWFKARQSDGWIAEVSTLETRGFPNRFDTFFTGLELADPNTGLAWTAPEFQILSLSYKPNHVIAVWPGTQTIATPLERLDIQGSNLKGSIIVAPDPQLPLDRSSVVMDDLQFVSSKGWHAGLEHGQLAVRRIDETKNSYELQFDARNLTPASDIIQNLSTDDILPPVIENITLNATAEFTAPWDRAAVEIARPQPTRVDLEVFKAQWGELELWLAGGFDIDPDGSPTGDITIKAKNWKEMVEIARHSGAIAPELVSTITGALQFIAGLSGNSQTLDIPLRLDQGLVFLGPFPIGNAPNLRIR
jgi:hypothetical protein